jgi:uncharacterized protein (UPF0303 family)
MSRRDDIGTTTLPADAGSDGYARRVTTGNYTTAALQQEHRDLELASFDAAQALTLGLQATERAMEDGLAIVIEVHHLGRLVYRAALPGSLPDSDDWIARKRRTVERYQRSTLATKVKYEERGTTFHESTGLSELEYAAHGGGMPIVVTGVGIVGGFYASGLPEVEDHRFLVSCLRSLASA